MTSAKTEIWQRRAHPVGIVTRYLATIAALAALWFHFWWVLIPCCVYLAVSVFIFPKPKATHSPLTKAAIGVHLERKMRRNRSDAKVPLYKIIPVLALLSLVVVVYFNALIQTVVLAILLCAAQVYLSIQMIKLYNEVGEGALATKSSRDSEADLADGFMKGRGARSGAKPRPKTQPKPAGGAPPVPAQRARMEQILETARKKAREK